jgi:hypothetical protein
MGVDVGIEFGQYKVIEHIGRGGMADVWSARDKRLHRTVAIKTIAPNIALSTDPVSLFEREAKTIAGLEHPHILPIYEFGDYQSQLYIVMRYVSGGSLDKLIQGGNIALDDVLRLARAIAGALAYAHKKNVVHLDLKPSNILLDSNDAPYLADFGLAAVMNPEGRAQNPGSGTLLYMAPEQLMADELDHRADIYSFCVMLFHMLTGQLPFDSLVPLSLKQIQENQDIPPLASAGGEYPAELDYIIRRGTAQDPEDRPGSILDLMREVESVLKPGGAATRAPGVLLDFSTSEAELGDLITGGQDRQALREAEDIYTRARRAWAHGQGRFLLGMTHFTLVSDYYLNADQHGLAVDDAGLQMLLRGALEYDHEIEAWWAKVSEEGRRWVVLHAMRSDNALARVRALQRLAHLTDTDQRAIPRQIARLLQVETNEEAMLAALDALAARSRLTPTPAAAPAPAEESTAPFDPQASALAAALSVARDTLYKGALKTTDVANLATDVLPAGTNPLARSAPPPDMATRQVIDPPTTAIQPPPSPVTDGKKYFFADELPTEAISASFSADSTPVEPPPAPSQPEVAAHSAVSAPVPTPDSAAPPAPVVSSSTPARATERLARLSTQLQLVSANLWQDVVFSNEIDLLLAGLALDAPFASVREKAARTIGRINSLAAVREIAAQQRAGAKGALRALALVRDEAPSLPSEVSGQARLYAWLANTWRRLSEDPMGIVWRFIFATLGGFLGIGLNTYLTFRSEAIFTPARWGNTIAIGLTCGVLVGFLVILADELPARLRGFWLWWARLIISAALALLTGTLVWGGYTYLFLQDAIPDWNVVFFAGAGIGVGFVAATMLRLPGWLSVIVTSICTFIPLYIAFTNYLPPVIYYDYPEQIITLGGMVALFIGLGGHARALGKDVRALSRRFARRQI